MLLALSMVAVATVGCARAQMQSPAGTLTPRAVPGPSTAALAFTPTVSRGFEDGTYLDRDGRGTYAAAGFESEVVTETYVRTDDRQRFDRFGDDGSFERRAISTTVTVRQR